MGEFTRVNYVGLSVAELDQHGFNGTPIYSIGYGYTCSGAVPPKGGWKFKWVNTRGMGNHGQLVVVPGDKRTYKIYQAGMFWRAVEAGMTDTHASRWAASKAGRKHELLGPTLSILNGPEAILIHWLAFPGIGPGLHLPWLTAGKSINGFDATCQLSVPRMDSLADIVDDCAGADYPGVEAYWEGIKKAPKFTGPTSFGPNVANRLHIPIAGG